MKSVLNPPKADFTAKRFHPPKVDFTRPQGRISLKKRLLSMDKRRFFLVGRGGFEPPKSLTADLQSAPFGHSGTYPYSLCVGAGGRTRTPDLLITNQLLYQLSYTSISLERSNTIPQFFFFVKCFLNFLSFNFERICTWIFLKNCIPKRRDPG